MPGLSRGALVVGSAPEVMADLAEAETLGVVGAWDVFAVNDVGCWYGPPIRHWVTIHGAKLEAWTAERAARGLSMDFRAHGAFDPESPGQAWYEPSGYPLERVAGHLNIKGSSGLLAALLALELGYRRILLAGVRLDGQVVLGQQREQRRGPHPYERYHEGWTDCRDALWWWVRSLGGWTQSLLGGPDPAWLEVDHDPEPMA